MRNLRKVITVLSVLSALAAVSLFGMEKAAADTVTHVQYHGCTNEYGAGSSHYRVTEVHLQRPDGSMHKNWFVDRINAYTGAMVFQNGFYGDSPYWVHIGQTLHWGNNCHFDFCAWPGYGWDRVWFHEDSFQIGRWGAGNPWFGRLDGNWASPSNNINQLGLVQKGSSYCSPLQGV